MRFSEFTERHVSEYHRLRSERFHKFLFFVLLIVLMGVLVWAYMVFSYGY